MKLHCYLKEFSFKYNMTVTAVSCSVNYPPTDRTGVRITWHTSGFISYIFRCRHAQQNHLKGIFSQQPQFVNLPLHIALCFHINIGDWQWSQRGWLPVPKATDGEQTESTNHSGVPRKRVRVFTSIVAVPLSHKNTHSKIHKCSYFKEIITHKCKTFKGEHKMCHLLVW